MMCSSTKGKCVKGGLGPSTSSVQKMGICEVAGKGSAFISKLTDREAVTVEDGAWLEGVEQ